MTKLVLAYDRSPKSITQLDDDFSLIERMYRELRPADLAQVKIGIQAMSAEIAYNGQTLVAGITMRDRLHATTSGLVQVGYDAKLHDIGNSMTETVRNMVGHWHWATVHASTARPALKRLMATTKTLAGANPTRRVGLMGVTVTSDFDDAECFSVYDRGCEAQVLNFAYRLKDAGITGIVCSGHELATLRDAGLADDFVTMVVGLRRDGDPPDDQMRSMTPQQVRDLGAEFAVVGRPIWNAKDPVETAGEFAEALSD